MAQEYLAWRHMDEDGAAVDVREDPQDAPGEILIRIEDARYRELSAWVSQDAVRTLRDALTAWLQRQEGI